MRVLGIETSTPMVSVALAEDGHLSGEFSLLTKQGHMRHLLPLIDQLFQSLEMSVGDLDGFAVSVGPGSFTSLRVGIATCKALAHTANKPVAEVPTLDLLAWGLQGTPDLLCPVITARQNEVYTAFYVSSDNGIKRLSSYLALNPERLAERFQEELKARITFVGEGAETNWDCFQGFLGDRAVLADSTRKWPRAGKTALLGEEILNREGGKKPGAVQALYVKSPAIRGGKR